MRLLAAVAAALVAAALADTGGGSASRALRLSAGRSATILHLPHIGRWIATCTADHRVAVAFVADQRLPTSDLVVARTSGAPVGRRVDPGDRVAPDAPGAVLAQQWQFAPFAAARVRVTTATVAARALDPDDAPGCAASVLAVTGPDQGATRTR